jgi:acyl dehydratase
VTSTALSVPTAADVTAGQELPTLTFRISRAQLVKYCGASGDFNVIHWNQRHALSVGLPDVIAHGLCTMGTSGRVVTDWIRDPTRVIEYGVRFSSPVPVADDDTGTEITVGAVVAEFDQSTGLARIEITARMGETDVMTRAYAIVQLA